MAYTGKFLVNNAPLSPLTINGIGTFNAYSGNNQYRNRGGCTRVPNDGALPPGEYWIVDRPTGGILLRCLHGQRMSGMQPWVTHRITVNGSRYIVMMERLIM
ncbi:DUF2778 domain-containing protein [Paraburkholderia sp. MMS20-SJTN17]|uniref:DUF2778 domain-containing protein n=1 Tax=Paraburkholderia translucens TaxID=2886945 RepID=A0ABS8K9S2_9BURK|nr:DUF2778 domain-containing protein [Paraburkholderia sp. MMS20-SJTN17]